MKSLLFIFTILFFIIPAFAQEKNQPKSFVAGVIDSMAEEYLKTLVRNAAIKAADEIARQALGIAVAGKISTALSVYGVIQNINAYNEAASETRRYQAASHAIADAITAVNAAVGGLAQFEVILQDLSAAYVYKDYLIQFARLHEEIVHLQKMRSDLIKSEYDTENLNFRTILSKTMAANQLAKTSNDQIKIRCSGDETSVSIQHLTQYYEQYNQHVAILKAQNFLLKATLSFQGRFINIPSLLQNADLAKDFKSYMDDLIHSDIAIKSTQRTADELIRLLSDLNVRNIQEKINIKSVAKSCERKILQRTMDLIKSRKADILNQNEWRYESSEEIFNDLQVLLTVTCNFVLDKIDPEILKTANLAY